MKLNKEKIAFIVVFLLVGYLAYSEASTDRGGNNKKKRRSRANLELAESQDSRGVVTAAWLKDGDQSWSVSGRNIYRAPSEHQSLPPLDLAVPPRPGLEVAAPQPSIGLDPFHRTGALKAVVPASDVVIPPREILGEETFAEEEPEPGEETAGESTEDPVIVDEEIDDRSETEQLEQDKKKARLQKKVLGIRERLQKQAEQKVQEERDRFKKKLETEEKQRVLDKIHWEGDTWYGTILNDEEIPEGEVGYDRYALKLRIDAIRGDAEMSNSDRDDALADREMTVEFRRWYKDKWQAVQRLSPKNIMSLEFGESPVNTFQIARRKTSLKDEQAHLALSQELIANDEFNLAKKHLLRMLEEGHKSRGLFVALADAANRDFDFDVELRALEDGLRTHQGDPDLIASQASLLARLKLMPQAERLFREALAAAPRNGRVNARFGLSILNSGRRHRGVSEQALGYLEKAVSARGIDRHRVLVDMARAQVAAGQLDRARTSFETVLNNDPSNVAAMNGLGSIDLIEAKYEAAKTQFTSILESDPTNGAAYYNLGLAKMHLGLWQESRDHLYDAVLADPMLAARARAACGYLYELVGDTAQAQIEYASAIEADPSDPEVILWHARGLILARDFEQAKSRLLEAMAKMPEQYDVLLGLAECSFELQENRDSLRYLNAALELNPESDTLLIRKAFTLSRLRKFSEAKECLDAAKRKGDSDLVELSLAYYYYAVGNHEEALKRFRNVERSLESGDDSPLAIYCREQAIAIRDNLEKQVWNDGFNRVATGDLLRGWKTYAPGSGIQVKLNANRVAFSGTQKATGTPSCLFQQRRSKNFVSFEAGIYAKPNDEATIGLALFSFRRNTGDQNPYVDLFSNGIANEGIILAKRPEGRIAYRIVTRFQLGRWTNVDATWPALVDGKAQAIRLGLEVEDKKKGTFRILVNGAPAATGVEVKGLSRSNRDLQLWAFTQAEIDKRIDVQIDDVRIVTRKDKK